MSMNLLVVDDFRDLVRVICHAREGMNIQFCGKLFEGLFCENSPLIINVQTSEDYGHDNDTLNHIASLVSEHKEFAIKKADLIRPISWRFKGPIHANAF